VYTEGMGTNTWIKIALLVTASAVCFSLAFAQPSKQTAGGSAKGKTVFDGQCAVCHNADSTVKKLGPGLKGLLKRAKLVDGKAMTEANVRALIDAGGNGMPPFKEMLNASQKDDLIAYLKTL
jgi:cytochrome c